MGNGQTTATKPPVTHIRRVTPKPQRTPAPETPRWLDTPCVATPKLVKSKYFFEDFTLDWSNVLGEGAFAQVITATHKSGVKSAVKVITKNKIPEDMRDYVAREPRVLSQLNNKNIVDILCQHEDEYFIYMFLKYLPGGDMHSRLERDDQVSEKIARCWFQQMISAVDYVHQKGYCHRDLKLENMLIIGERTKAKVVLIDFGFAGEVTGPNHKFDDFPGSISYAAPELLKGIPYNGYSADIYSLGVILYTLIHGMYPFYSEDRNEMFKQVTTANPVFEPTVSKSAIELMDWMLKKNPKDRPTLEQIKASDFFQAGKATQNPIVSPVKAQFTPLKTKVNIIKNQARNSLSPKFSRKRNSFA